MILSQSDIEQMLRLQRQLADVMNQFKRVEPNAEPVIGAFALVRLARELLNKYPSSTRDVAIEIIEKFLESNDRDADLGKIIRLH